MDLDIGLNIDVIIDLDIDLDPQFSVHYIPLNALIFSTTI